MQVLLHKFGCVTMQCHASFENQRLYSAKLALFFDIILRDNNSTLQRNNSDTFLPLPFMLSPCPKYGLRIRFDIPFLLLQERYRLHICLSDTDNIFTHCGGEH
jgi:hypothetical protein